MASPPRGRLSRTVAVFGPIVALLVAAGAATGGFYAYARSVNQRAIADQNADIARLTDELNRITKERDSARSGSTASSTSRCT